MRILVVEDERYLADALSHVLSRNNYGVDTVYDGESGYDNAATGLYDVIILDIMLPKLNGLELLRRLRKEKIKTPVILLTAKSDIADKIAGLDSGADDYLAKPFDSGELMARIRAITRRGEIDTEENKIVFEDISLDPDSMKLYGQTREVSLTKREFDMLEYLIINKNRVIKKEQMIDRLWGFDSEAEANHVEVYISFIRKKLGFVSNTVVINTVRGIGYKLEKSNG